MKGKNKTERGGKRKKIKEKLHKKSEKRMKKDRQRGRKDNRKIKQKDTLNKHKYGQDRQCKYKRNVKARLCNHYCSGKTISIIYSLSLCVTLGIQHAMRLRHIVICCLTGSKIFFNIIS